MTRGIRCDEVGAKQMGGREGGDAMKGGGWRDEDEREEGG